MNASDFYKMLASWTLYEGEAFYVPIRKFRSTQIEKLVPVRKSQVTKDIDENGTLHYNVTFDNKVKQRYRFDEIVHLKEFTLNGVDGVSPLEYARHTVQTGLNQMVFEKSFYANYGRPNDYLKTATDLSSKKIEKDIVQADGTVKKIQVSLKDIMREEWAKAHSGDRLYSTAILDNGLEYGTVPQITPEQMQFVSAKAVTVEDIARFFDMANCLHKLGMGKQTYSTNEQGQISYVTETIVPRLRRWEQEFTLKLLTEEQREQGWVIKGNINAELRGDTSARATWYEKMQQMGAYTINNILALEDMPSIGEEGDVRLCGPNKTPLEVLTQGGTPADVTPNVPTEEKVEPTEEQVEETNNKRRKP
jgi:phage portal protein BeeE